MNFVAISLRFARGSNWRLRVGCAKSLVFCANSNSQSSSNTPFSMTVHIPVLVDEILETLDPQPGELCIDGTLGGGGHTVRLLERIGEAGRVIGFDRDPTAVEETTSRIDDRRLTTIVANYADIPEQLECLAVDQVNSILLDLGLSSDQLADRDRGFSYQSDGALDLRFNPLAGEPASRLVNRLSEKHLANLIYEFGEERLSRRIARKIVSIRHHNKIETSQQLAKIVRSCVPRSKNHSIDPATRTFQALRIAVNEELKWLAVAMDRLPGLLSTRRSACRHQLSFSGRPHRQACIFEQFRPENSDTEANSGVTRGIGIKSAKSQCQAASCRAN